MPRKHAETKVEILVNKKGQHSIYILPNNDRATVYRNTDVPYTQITQSKALALAAMLQIQIQEI